MRTPLFLLAALLLFLPGCQRKTVEGQWNGELAVAGTKLRLALNIEKGTEGKYTAKLDSLDQNAKGLPIDVTEADGKIRMDAKTIGGSFEGKMSEDANELTGNWSQAGMTIPLTLKRKTDEAAK